MTKRLDQVQVNKGINVVNSKGNPRDSMQIYKSQTTMNMLVQ